MYNRYLTPNDMSSAYEPLPCCEKSTESNNPVQNLLGSIGAFKFDIELIFAIGVIWFLLADGEATDTDLLIIIGVLLLIGL